MANRPVNRFLHQNHQSEISREVFTPDENARMESPCVVLDAWDADRIYNKDCPEEIKDLWYKNGGGTFALVDMGTSTAIVEVDHSPDELMSNYGNASQLINRRGVVLKKAQSGTYAKMRFAKDNIPSLTATSMSDIFDIISII